MVRFIVPKVSYFLRGKGGIGGCLEYVPFRMFEKKQPAGRSDRMIFLNHSNIPQQYLGVHKFEEQGVFPKWIN